MTPDFLEQTSGGKEFKASSMQGSSFLAESSGKLKTYNVDTWYSNVLVTHLPHSPSQPSIYFYFLLF